MLIPLRTDSPLRATPWANWVLIAANVLIFLITSRYPDLSNRYTLNPAHLQLLDYFTYQFLHANIPHLLFNMLFLYVFGNNVNDRMGNLGYIAFYLAGGVFAGIGYVIFEPHPIVGASGAIAAVTGAYLVLLPRSHVTIVYFILLIGVTEIPSIWLILGYFFLQDLVLQFLHSESSTDNVAHIAHLSGTIFGFGIAMLMLSAHLLPRDQFDVLALMQRWNKRRTYQGLVRNGYDPFAYAPPIRAEPNPQFDRIHDLRASIAEALAARNTTEGARLFVNLNRIDPAQVLSRQNQLDVGNQLYSDGQYAAAAAAYELFLMHYPKFETAEHIRLILGILYSRYLQKPAAAREQFTIALERLHDERDRALAINELQTLGPPAPASPETPPPATPISG